MDQLADLSSALPQNLPPPSKRSPAAAAKGDEHHGRPNFASLPDVVLLILFKMLPVPDRGRLARTCSRLSDFMRCPTVWTDVFIKLHETITKDSRKVSCLGPQDSSMIKKYGAYFRRATIVFPYSLISQEVCDMLSQFTEKEVKLKLFVQQGVSVPTAACKRSRHFPLLSLDEPFHNVIAMRDTFSSSTTISVELSQRLFRVFLITDKVCWSRKFESLCSTLTDLVLPELWSEQLLARGYNHLPPAPTAAVISYFHALRRLKLGVHNASEELLLELADSSGRRSPLRSLVFEHIDGEVSRLRAFPQLSSAAWRNLTSACPSLTVECYFVCHRMPPLSQVIKPETTLVKLEVTCNKYSDTDSAQFAQVCTEHKSTLHFYRLSAGFDQSIVRTQEYWKIMGWNVLD